jgi:UDP-N-acetylmuramyl pentapeptide synthase
MRGASTGIHQLKAGLASFLPTEGRGDIVKVPGRPHLKLINDAYNANPASMQAALQALFSSRSESANDALILVISGMNELGEHAERYHRELGSWLSQQSGIAGLVLVGSQEAEWMAEGAHNAAFPIHQALSVADVPDALKALDALNPATPTTLYLKGSRGFGLDQLANLLAVAEQTSEQILR